MTMYGRQNPPRGSWDTGKPFLVSQLYDFQLSDSPFSSESVILPTHNHIHPCMEEARLVYPFPLWP